MNVETKKHLKPGPVSGQLPIATALREMVSGRFDPVPAEMSLLLRSLERPKRAA